MLVGALGVKAQGNAFEGKRFWFSVLRPVGSFGPQDNFISLWSRTNATVTISNPAKGFNTVVNLTANNASTVTIPASASTHTLHEQVDSFGLEITSTADITVLATSTANTSDGTYLYPLDNLGTEYYAISFAASGVGFNQGKSSIVIVATEDNTVVEITPSVLTEGLKAANTPFFVTLNKGQTYRVEGANTADLTGTRVRVINGCKKIAVFSGSTCSQVPETCTNCGHLVEMMPHVGTLGKTFVIAPLATTGFFTAKFTYRVLAIANGTKVIINGTTFNLNKGQSTTTSGNSSTTTICIESNNPVIVAQYMEGFGCQGGAVPRMAIISPSEQLVKSASIFGQNTGTFGANNRILIISKTNSRGRVRKDNIPIGAVNFSTFSSCSEWSYADISVTTQGPFTITSDSGFLAYMYNDNFNFAYIYPAAVNTRILKYDIGLKPLVCGSSSVTFYNTGDSSNISSSVWTFDDNTSLTGKQVTKNFGAQGIYAVHNVVTYLDNCSYVDTITTSVRTLAKPVPGFSVNNPVQCFIGNDFYFADTSKYPNSSKRLTTTWNFNDTNVDFKNQFNIGRIFGTPGQKTIKLIATSADLCTDSFTYIATVNANAKPDYQVTNPQCFKSHSFSPVQLSSVAGSTIVGYEWDFGDGGQSTLASPTKTFAKDSTYEITLIAKAATGCNDTIHRTFTIYPSPTASFTTANVCLNDTLKATNGSTFGGGPLSYQWKFGDGNTSTQTDIVKTYADTGTYNLILTATTTDGCPDSMVKAVKILPAPKPDFSFAKQCTRNPSTFTNKTFNYGQNPTTYTWNTGDSAYTSTHVVHNYKKEGKYTVRLYATLPNGCTDSTNQTLYINPNPNVNFTINDSLQCQRGNTFDFFNNTTISEGKIKSFTWKLNDTLWTTSTSINNQVFNTFGSSTVKLVVVTDSLCADSISKVFEVAPQTQVDLVLGQDTQCFKNHSFSLTNNSSVPAGTVKYYWKYSNGDIDTVDHPANKVFSTAGKYQLTLLAVTNKGCRDSVVRNLTLYPSPELEFEVNDVCGTDSARFFNPSKVSTGRIITWDWDLGDGSTSTTKHPIHHYNNLGFYNVRLIGITDLGCPDTLSKDSALEVKPAPTSYFNTQLIKQQGNATTYDFFEQAQGETNYFWNFDRGQTSREANPRFIFTDTGRYHIILAVSNNNGCFDYYDTTIIVVPDIEVFIPNAFSPNKDVINPTFRIEGSYFYREFEMRIFDRWGHLVFYSTDPEIGWDGSYDDKLLPDGVYIYHIRMIGTDTRVRNYRGNIHLLR